MDETLLQLLRELVAEYDPTLNTAEGGDFYAKVMVPFLTRIGPDPLSGDPEAFIAAYLDSEFGGELDTSALSDLRQILIRPGAIINNALRREISANRSVRSLADYELMTRDELNARLSDFFVTMRSGGTVSLAVRVYFRTPQARTFTTTTRFYTGSGLAFYPTSTQAITAAEMSFQVEGSLYYVDVNVTAAGAGSSYVVAAREILGVDGVPGVVRVANPRSAAAVDDDETKAAAVDRARDSITQRNLTTLRGVTVMLPEDLGSFDDILPVGSGHELMMRDLIQGPVTIGGIPGGVRGRRAPSLGAGQGVHVGGHTDVYARRGEPQSDSMDISAIADFGYQVFTSTQGFTAGGPPTHVWQDPTGNFSMNGVRVGDYLVTRAEVPRRIAAVNAYSLTLDGDALTGGTFAQTYEVVRRVPGYVTIPLCELVAVSGGAPLLDATGAPVRPVPGSAGLTPLVVGGAPVLATENVCTENALLPILRVTSVELLDPTTLEPTDLFLPQADLFGVRAATTFTGGGVSSKATGRLRCYFKDAVNCYAGVGTSFRIGSWYYRGRTRASGVVGSLGVTATVAEVDPGVFRIQLLNADYVSTGRVSPGDRISGTAFIGTYCIVSATYDIGTAPHTVLQVREQDVLGWYTAETPNENATLCPGTLRADIPYDASVGMYYLDLDVEAAVAGAGGNAPEGTSAVHLNGVQADGWYLKSPKEAESYSTRDRPYLQVSDWPDDETWVADPGADYALRVSYSAAPNLVEVQAYVEDDTYECVGEDVLVRHFIPAYVRAAFTSNVPDRVAAKAALDDHLWGLKSGAPLQVSDLGDVLSRAGSTYTRLPVQLVVLKAAVNRTWELVVSEDQVEATAAHHFLPDGSYLSVSGA